jgi:hypothetical protein
MGDVVRFQPLDSAWQTLGTERYRGVVAENIVSSSNPAGPDQCSFTVKTVEPASPRPDLLPYTPIEIETDGMLVWAGRVKARPSAEQEHAVQCEGWQYHLDDGAYNCVYVHTRLGDYRDQRGFLGADLTKFTVAGTVSVDNGVITIGWPNGAVIPTAGDVGVTLDLGQDSTAKRAVMTWESTNNNANFNAIVRAKDAENPLGGSVSDAITFVMNTGASGTTSGTFATAYRYIHVFLNNTSGAPVTLAADLHLRVTALKIFRLTAYETANISVLRADTVVKDALLNAPLLNQSTDAISATTFNIPEYLTSDYQSPREVIESVNAYENNRIKIGGSDLKTLIYDAKPTAALYEVGEGSGSQFSDSSVSGEDIYTTAIVTGTGPDGGKLVSTRSQTGTLVDRQGGTRTKVLPIRSAGTTAVYNRFGDLWLIEHNTAPFSGKLTATSGIRRLIGGASVPPHEMLLASGEKIRLSHRLDPDTGGWGRDGRIAGVTYTHATKEVAVDIDDQRDRFENVLARYGILVDQFV